MRERVRPHISIVFHVDRTGHQFAWIETRLPGGWAISRRAAVGMLRRHRPGAHSIRIDDQWHVPLKHRSFKIYFDT